MRTWITAVTCPRWYVRGSPGQPGARKSLQRWQPSSCVTAPTYRKRTPRTPASGVSPSTTRRDRCTTPPTPRRRLPHSDHWTTTNAVPFSRAHICPSAERVTSCALITIGADTVLFSGDLGRTRHPLLLAREAPPGARTVVIESTYGDRAHPADGVPTHEILAAAICRTVKRGGSVLVPAFAVDRTELVLRNRDGIT